MQLDKHNFGPRLPLKKRYFIPVKMENLFLRTNFVRNIKQQVAYAVVAAFGDLIYLIYLFFNA